MAYMLMAFILMAYPAVMAYLAILIMAKLNNVFIVTHRGIMKNKKDIKIYNDFRAVLKYFADRAEAGEVKSEDITYVCCLLKMGYIDSFKKGRISRKVMEDFLYGSHGEVQCEQD
jgi:hypothetical protein